MRKREGSRKGLRAAEGREQLPQSAVPITNHQSGASIRDRVASGFDIPVKSTAHHITLAQQGRLPDKIMINTHPQRWEDRPLPWIKELTTLTHTTVIHLCLDYLLHALMFMPLAPLWRLGFPRHPLRLIIPAGLALAVGLEGVQYLLPYRAWNENDAIGKRSEECGRGLEGPDLKHGREIDTYHIFVSKLTDADGEEP